MPPKVSKSGVDPNRYKVPKKPENNCKNRKRRPPRPRKRQLVMPPVEDEYFDQSNMSDASLTSNQKAVLFRSRLKNLLDYEKAIREALDCQTSNNNTTTYCTDENGQYRECECEKQESFCKCDDGIKYEENYDDPATYENDYCNCDYNSQDEESDTVYCNCDVENIKDENYTNEMDIPNCQCEN